MPGKAVKVSACVIEMELRRLVDTLNRLGAGPITGADVDIAESVGVSVVEMELGRFVGTMVGLGGCCRIGRAISHRDGTRTVCW